jgi:hypothetical protein
MSWTDFFLVPFNVALNRGRSVGSAVGIKAFSEDFDNHSAKSLRDDILSIIEVYLYKNTTEQLCEMIFGDDYSINLENKAQLVSCFDTLQDFKDLDDIYIDTIDKMIINELINRLGCLIQQARHYPSEIT